jgi:hypothetical protein
MKPLLQLGHKLLEEEKLVRRLSLFLLVFMLQQSTVIYCFLVFFLSFCQLIT